jgi:regulator of protease activity HflC (stomatin/prohibitin superfamily)
MTTQPVTTVPLRTSRRALNTVQRTLRAMIWLVVFFALLILTVLFSFALGLSGGSTLGIAALSVGLLVDLIVPGLITRCLYITPEYQRIVTLRLGEFSAVKGPGRFWVIPYPPFYQSVVAELDIRVQTRVITASQTLTRDNVPVGCEAVIFWRVEDPKRAALEVADYNEAVFQAANSALRDTVGMLELSDLLSERDKVARQLKDVIDRVAASFGIDVSSVEITDIHVPADLIQELSVIAQSRRSAQAKIAEAEVELEVARRLREAADIMSPNAMDMYRLNVIERIGREEGSQIVIYGLGGSDPELDRGIAAAAAGSMVGKKQPDSPQSGLTGTT